MNSKAVKKLRRMLDYHPTDPRKYTNRVTKKINEKNQIVELNSIQLDPIDLRYKYQQMKRGVL